MPARSNDNLRYTPRPATHRSTVVIHSPPSDMEAITNGMMNLNRHGHHHLVALHIIFAHGENGCELLSILANGKSKLVKLTPYLAD